MVQQDAAPSGLRSAMSAALWVDDGVESSRTFRAASATSRLGTAVGTPARVNDDMCLSLGSLSSRLQHVFDFRNTRIDSSGLLTGPTESTAELGVRVANQNRP